MRNSAADMRERRVRGEMRLHASRKGFCDRAVEIVYQSLLCDLGSMLEARGQLALIRSTLKSAR